MEKPGRYVGGEYGAVCKDSPGCLTVALSYPDLYEIGMSNSAVRIIYNLLNGLDGVSCERVFAPAPDFEAGLRSSGIPLYSLETGRPLSGFDLIGFSLGYELTFTNLLAILDLGGVPLRAEERSEGDPIVIAGGPAATNPAPFGPFVDCVFIGEAEGWAEEAFSRLAEMKRAGASRSDLLETLRHMPPIWHRGKKGGVRRSVWRGFSVSQARSGLPVPNIRTVQDHGTVEIMRGCPNVCRFCHATCFYRPARRKDPDVIMRETRELVRVSGYRHVTLSSLSSGEFDGIRELVERLNSMYARERVSFSLPSLHIDSLGLALLRQISQVRKSGLTFAVETPLSEWQEAVGKNVPLGKTIDILKEARGLGWRSAKLYFMVGLPVSFQMDESTPIIEFIQEIGKATGMTIHANVASFIPKPHTPFQRAAQLREAEALARIMTVKNSLRGGGFKIGYHAPMLSLLEGIVSRGDERAGCLVLEAYRKGARLDAWEEHLRSDLWREVIEGASWEVEKETCRPRGEDEELPWDAVDLNVTHGVTYEAGRSVGCPAGPSRATREMSMGAPGRVLFSFSKTGKAALISHLDLMTVFERALARSCRAVFTEGFNPKPRLEFASPLGLGIESDQEIAGVELEDWDSGERFAEGMNGALPDGLRVGKAEKMAVRPDGKKPSLMAAYWGSEYRISAFSTGWALDELLARLETESLENARIDRTRDGAVLKLQAGPAAKSLLSIIRAESRVRLIRTRTFACGTENAPADYFEVFCGAADGGT